MAEKKAGGLSLRIGLTLSQLQSDFLAAEQTVKQGIAALNRQSNIVRLKMETDITGLDRVKDATKIIEIQERGLNQLLEMQRDKLTLATKAYQEYSTSKNANAVATKKLETVMERERLAVARLEAELKNLSSQKVTPQPVNSLLSGYQNIKGNVTGTLSELSNAFSQLQGATSSADSAITATLGVIGSIPSPVGKAVAALASFPIVLKGIENSFVDMTKAAAASGDSVYVMSRGFQMSIADTAKFTTMCKTAGVEVNDLASTLKRVQQSIIRSGEGGNSKAEQWLKRYGESAFDASGRLKNLNDMTLTLSRALKRAQADGNGMAFILGTMRNASADAITAIEDAEDVYKQASTTVANGLANPKLAHEVQGNINQMNDQAAKMNASFSSALLPVANEIIPRLTDRMGKMTTLIKENRGAILEFGRATAEVFMAVESLAEKATGAVITVGKELVELKKKPGQDELVERFKFDLEIENVDDLIKKAQPKVYDFIKNDSRLYAQVKAQYQPIYQAIADAQAEIKAKQEELNELLKMPVSVANFSLIGQERNQLEENEAYLESLRQARKYQEEAEAILYKMNHNDYENKELDLEQWRTSLVREAELSAQEREAAEKLYSAKSAQIEQERADKLKEIRASVAAADKTSLQNTLDNIEKERQAWLKAGMEIEEANALSKKKIDKANQEAAEKIQKYLQDAADIEYELTHTAYEKQLRDIERWKEAKIKAGEDASAIIQNAAAKEAQAFEREVERIKGKVQSLEDKIFAQEHSQYENDLRKLQQERAELYKEGVYSPIMIERYFSNAMKDLNARAKESRGKGGDYTRNPNGTQSAMQRGIGLMTDENQIRNRLIATLDKEAQASVERMQSMKDTVFSMPQMAIPDNLQGVPVGNITTIEGDEITQISIPDFKAEMEKYQAQIAQYMQIPTPDISQYMTPQMQLPQETTMTFETIVTPLNNIEGLVQNILTELGNKQPAQINVSSSPSVNLGGAYVFDNALKKQLVDDITSCVVSEITSAVERATSRGNYSYGT